MNSPNPEYEIKKIFEKSVRLLSVRESQIDAMRQMLMKTVHSLSVSSHGSDGQINNVLNAMEISVNQQNLELLGEQLDDFLLLTKNSGNHESSDSTELNKIEGGPLESDSVGVNSVLIDIVNGLSLSGDETRVEQIGLLDALANADNDTGDVSEKIVTLVNQNIGSLQQKNDDLQAFIIKINKHLSEIKSFINITRQCNSDTANRSSALQQSVDSSVGIIQEKVTSANDVNELKNDISVHLQKIHKQVEENKLAEIEREESSAESFAHVISELNDSQDELTQLKSQLKETKSQLLRDSLTGLHNRLAYENRVDVEFSRYKRSGAPLCLAMWDLDHFKNINDTYGHDAGDRVLKVFSEFIQARIRKTDMFARMGGEEFVLLLPDTPIEYALSLNDELRETFEKCKFNYNDEEFTVTASIGLAAFCDNETPQAILKKSDLALYQSKSGGRNRCTIFNV